MDFFVGYQMNAPHFLDEIIQNKDRISEVYFSWGSYANGRHSQLRQHGMSPWEAQSRLEADLYRLSQAGIGLNILFNAMCYGKDSQSRRFFQGIGDTLETVSDHFLLRSVTTTSPLIAKFVKSNFPQLDVRASVNMDIGTPEGMDYVKESFDSFYLQREKNRDLAVVRALASWCAEHGKKLYLLANSGCLNHCSARVFHDNLVAHEDEISAMANGYQFKGICGNYLKENPLAAVKNTSYIRPEDVHIYEGLVPAMKLATRVNADPVRVLRAYLRGSYSGSTLELLEPNHTSTLYPLLLENRRLEATVHNDRLEYQNAENALIHLEEEICSQVQ